MSPPPCFIADIAAAAMPMLSLLLAMLSMFTRRYFAIRLVHLLLILYRDVTMLIHVTYAICRHYAIDVTFAGTCCRHAAMPPRDGRYVIFRAIAAAATA